MERITKGEKSDLMISFIIECVGIVVTIVSIVVTIISIVQTNKKNVHQKSDLQPKDRSHFLV